MSVVSNPLPFLAERERIFLCPTDHLFSSMNRRTKRVAGLPVTGEVSTCEGAVVEGIP